MALLLQDRLLPGVAELVPELEEIRHDIHAHPELGFETERTVGLICDYHRKSGIVEIDTELVKGCVIAVIEGSRPGHTIAIRADMDALVEAVTNGEVTCASYFDMTEEQYLELKNSVTVK